MSVHVSYSITKANPRNLKTFFTGECKADDEYGTHFALGTFRTWLWYWLVLFKQIKKPTINPLHFPAPDFFSLQKVCNLTVLQPTIHSLCLWIQKYILGFLEGLTDGKMTAFTTWHLRRQDSDSLPEPYQYLMAGSCACQMTLRGWFLSPSCLEREDNLLQPGKLSHFCFASFLVCLRIRKTGV